jgi:hypothetical protein
MIRAAEANVAMVTDKTIAIPGHGPIGGKAELTEYRDLLVTSATGFPLSRRRANRSRKYWPRSRLPLMTPGGLDFLLMAISLPSLFTREPNGAVYNRTIRPS